MNQKAVTSEKVKEEPVKHVLLDCVSSPEGKTLYCRRIKPKDVKKVLQKNEGFLVSSMEVTSSKMAESDEEYGEPDLEINLVSDLEPDESVSQDKCEQDECEAIEGTKYISRSIHDELTEGDKMENGTEDPEVP